MPLSLLTQRDRIVCNLAPASAWPTSHPNANDQGGATARQVSQRLQASIVCTRDQGALSGTDVDCSLFFWMREFEISGLQGLA